MEAELPAILRSQGDLGNNENYNMAMFISFVPTKETEPKKNSRPKKEH